MGLTFGLRLERIIVLDLLAVEAITNDLVQFTKKIKLCQQATTI
jgi:hypothetical protein